MSAAETTSCVRKGLRRLHGASGALASASGVHLRMHILLNIWDKLFCLTAPAVALGLGPSTQVYVLAQACMCLQGLNGTLLPCGGKGRAIREAPGRARYKSRRIEELYQATVLGAAVAEALAVHEEGAVVRQQAQRRQQVP